MTDLGTTPRRAVPEWIGATPDTAPPPRVKLRVFERAGGYCEAGCGRKLRPGDAWQADHTIAVVNGGRNAESNLRVACDWCHKAKTRADVAEKSAVADRRKAHLGIKATKRPMPGSRASGLRKRMDGTVERRG